MFARYFGAQAPRLREHVLPHPGQDGEWANSSKVADDIHEKNETSNEPVKNEKNTMVKKYVFAAYRNGACYGEHDQGVSRLDLDEVRRAPEDEALALRNIEQT